MNTQAFIGRFGHGPAPLIAGLLRPIDTKRLTQDLRLTDNGKERGARELPQSEDSSFDGVEQDVIQRIQSEWAWQCSELTKVLKAYSENLAQYSIASLSETLHIGAKNVLTQLLEAKLRANPILGPLKSALTEAKEEFIEFRARHKLRRPARTNEKKYTTLGLLVFLIAVESLANGLFFSKGSDHGLLGGVATAVGISFFNVIAAFLLGLFPARWINHRSLVVKMIGVVVTTAGLAALLALHVFAAHLRDAISLGGDESSAMQSAIATLLEAPWRISDLTSLYLAGLGIVCGLSSFWKGYKYDDPYPGYGAVWRRYENARQSYTDEHHELFADLEELKEDVIEKLENGVNQIPVFAKKAEQIKAARLALIESIRAYEPAMESSANLLLQTYRDANRLARKTAPPSRFDSSWSLPHSFLKQKDFLELSVDVPVMSDAEVDQTLTEIRGWVVDILAQYDTLIQANPDPSSIALSQ